MEKITTNDQFEKAMQTGRSIFVFSADWCPDCLVIKPILPEIEERFSNYTFYHVERDEMMDLLTSLDIYGIPSFVAYENGKEIGRFVSKDRKTKEQIETFIESLD